MTLEEFMESLKQECDDIMQNDMTFVLIPEKAKLAQDIFIKVKTILDVYKSVYTIEIRKGAFISTSLCIDVLTNQFKASGDNLNNYRDIINTVDEVAYIIDEDEKINVRFWIKDAYIQVTD